MANMALPTPCMSTEPLQRNHTHAERHLFHGLQIAQWYEFQDLNSDQELNVSGQWMAFEEEADYLS